MLDSSLMTHRSTSFTWEERFGPSRAFKDETAPKRDNDARLRTFHSSKSAQNPRSVVLNPWQCNEGASDPALSLVPRLNMLVEPLGWLPKRRQAMRFAFPYSRHRDNQKDQGS